MLSSHIPSTLTAGTIASMVKGELIGDGNIEINGVASLSKAEKSHLSFLGNEKYRHAVPTSLSGIVLVPPDYSELPPANRAWIKCAAPSEAFALITAYFSPPERKPCGGIHATAVIADSAQIFASAHIGAYVIIGENTVIGENTIIEAGSYIGHDIRIGNNCRIHPRVTILDGSILGNHVIIHSGTIIGSDGFGFTMSAEGHKKIPQTGIVQIDDNVEIGANVTIDRARFDRTWIKNGVHIDNLVQIAHNVVIGRNSVIVAQVGISGSTEVGDHVILAGQVGIAGHLTIGDHATIMGKSGIMNDVEAGATLLGIPAIPRRQFWKQNSYLQKLPEFSKQLKKIESDIATIKQMIAVKK